MKISTRQRQHPTELVSPGRVRKIVERDRARKWLGSTTSAHTHGSHRHGLEHHLAAAFSLLRKPISSMQQKADDFSPVADVLVSHWLHPKKGLPSDMRAQSQDQNICNKRLCPFQKNEHILPLWLP